MKKALHDITGTLSNRSFLVKMFFRVFYSISSFFNRLARLRIIPKDWFFPVVSSLDPKYVFSSCINMRKMPDGRRLTDVMTSPYFGLDEEASLLLFLSYRRLILLKFSARLRIILSTYCLDLSRSTAYCSCHLHETCYRLLHMILVPTYIKKVLTKR